MRSAKEPNESIFSCWRPKQKDQQKWTKNKCKLKLKFCEAIKAIYRCRTRVENETQNCGSEYCVYRVDLLNCFANSYTKFHFRFWTSRFASNVLRPKKKVLNYHLIGSNLILANILSWNFRKRKQNHIHCVFARLAWVATRNVSAQSKRAMNFNDFFFYHFSYRNCFLFCLSRSRFALIHFTIWKHRDQSQFFIELKHFENRISFCLIFWLWKSFHFIFLDEWNVNGKHSTTAKTGKCDWLVAEYESIGISNLSFRIFFLTLEQIISSIFCAVAGRRHRMLI